MPIEDNSIFSNELLSDTSQEKFQTEKLSSEKTLQEYAYDQLRKWIEIGDLEGGERVAEVRVAKLLNMSRVPVREAILKLKADGLVKALPRGGYVVREYTLSEVVQLYEMREAIEGMSARLAVERGDSEEINKIKEANEAMKKYGLAGYPSDGPELYYKRICLDDTFHRQILIAGKNKYALELFGRMSSRFVSVSSSLSKKNVPPADEDGTLETHQYIVDAFFSGEPDKAEKAVKAHIRRAKNIILNGSKEQKR